MPLPFVQSVPRFHPEHPVSHWVPGRNVGNPADFDRGVGHALALLAHIRGEALKPDAAGVLFANIVRSIARAGEPGAVVDGFAFTLGHGLALAAGALPDLHAATDSAVAASRGAVAASLNEPAKTAQPRR